MAFREKIRLHLERVGAVLALVGLILWLAFLFVASNGPH